MTRTNATIDVRDLPFAVPAGKTPRVRDRFNEVGTHIEPITVDGDVRVGPRP